MTAVTVLSVLALAAPASAAPQQATAAASTVSAPATQQAAVFRGYYRTGSQCASVGQAGIRAGVWPAFICIFDVSVRFYALYA